MSTTVKACLAAGGCVGIVAAGVFDAPASAQTAQDDAGSGLVSMQADDVGRNSVAAYHRHGDSTLAEAGTYATGGPGGRPDEPDVDQPASLGSVAYDCDI
jgi:hypothetical protein